MNHKSTNGKTRTHQIIQNLNTHHHFLDKFLNMPNNFPDHHQIYADESKQEMKVSCAAAFQKPRTAKCLLNELSINIAEVTAFLADVSNAKIPYTELKPIINKFIHNKWQKWWDNQIHNKLHYIQDTIGEWPAGYRRNRIEVILRWLCIGQTHITNSHLLKSKTPQYAKCVKYTLQPNTFS